MFKKIYLLAGFLAVLPLLVKAQQPPLIFADGTKVCFVGNSITMNGEFIHYVRAFYATRFPDKKISFINCGISGDVTSGILDRMQPDIMVHKPNYAVIMIGMNDVGRPLYAAKWNGNDSILQKRKELLATYKKNLTEIVEYFVTNKVTVILQKPSIYDQTAKLPQENMYGANDALNTCAGYMQELADRFKLRTVDYFTLMSEINKKYQQRDSSFTIVGKDRVHPASPGHFTMAYQFLNSTIGRSTVSSIQLDAKSKKNNSGKGITISQLKFEKNGFSFELLPSALPFAMNPAAAPALEYMPFTEKFNQEILQVRGLPTGNYRLYMNDTIAGEFKASDFNTGINLALLNTPEMQQSQALLQYCQEMKKLESDLRQIRHMEYKTLYRLPNGNIQDSGIAILQRKLADTTTKQNERGPAERYLKNKPKEAALYREWEVMEQKLYEINKPKVVKVRIERI